MEEITLVWLKRDLRLRDHAPLKGAIERGLPILLVYVAEPSLLQADQSDNRHWRFVWEGLCDLNQSLAPVGTKVLTLYSEVLAALQTIQRHVRIRYLYSHQETGIRLTYERDKAVTVYCREQGISWCEWPQQGVQRGRKNRSGWSEQWDAFMHQPLEDPDWKRATFLNPDRLDFLRDLFWQQPPAPNPAGMQQGGEKKAQRYLRSFLEGRVRDYSRHISKPEASRRSCSRLSPYLAWGNLSVRQVFQATETLRKSGVHAGQIRNFQSRLRWHCHFIQKFEMEPRMELAPINTGFSDYGYDKNPVLLEAWKQGTTGLPLVDACMRCLTATGYLNFRMRAMLVSFLTHQLNLDWREGAAHLARLFLDFEPGIHYPQLQMQAGVTGINQVRIYNPIKQSREQDPEGLFIKKWVPELADIPFPHFHEPWKMSPIEQQFYRFKPGETYPLPVVDPELASKKARDAIWKAQSLPQVKADAKRILAKHTLAKRWR
ncbi:cryptochrome/deoxyribodipyrimidine photo-lyase family protein [Cyclobacterium xiamenense]|uniref:cryptochrome/deoxyribodipyrimidine photo-lyase family protein n=1 Tax=Cyclobacterium xiamenense TaxID=1297121 RepID=UPI0012BA3029|nr:deoxyribodipyrimidine photo-lyase [Cyclobacterium xiamenense]